MTGLDSIIESLYLMDELTCSSKSCNILVNPMSSYVVGKTVIINISSYPESYINELLCNNNTVISRFEVNNDRVIVDPYELRMNDSIIPLGKKIDLINEEIYDKVYHIFDKDEMKLYYPKPTKCLNYCVGNNLTVIGYLAYQLGFPINDISDTRFTNLDVIKLKNGIII